MKVLTETFPTREAVNEALIEKKGILNHLKLTNNFKSNGSSVHKPHSHFTVKREPTLNIEKSNTCVKCGGNFSKGHLAVFPAKDTTCTSCKYKGHLTRLDVTTIFGDDGKELKKLLNIGLGKEN